jgi:predicted double-glycine peptidase
MASNWVDEIPFSRMKRVAQINDYFCGPAVLRMLLSFWGVKILQKEIVNRLGIDSKKIRKVGMNMLEMSNAVEIVAPQMQFWSKQRTELRELNKLINHYRIPVGVEWQGIFEEYADEEGGHFSIVTYLNLSENRIMLADPFGPFSEEDRKFSIARFQETWWDDNLIEEPDGKKYIEFDEKMIFLIAPKGESFPEELGMVCGVDRGVES